MFVAKTRPRRAEVSVKLGNSSDPMNGTEVGAKEEEEEERERERK